VRRLAGLPGWLLLAVWLAVPAVAVALVVLSLGDDPEEKAAAPHVPGLGAPDVDVQAPELRRQREAAGIADCPEPSRQPPADPDLPALALPCLGDPGTVDLATLDGPVVLNVWAQSCGPCRDEMPLLQRLHAEADGEVTVLGIDFQDLQPELALELAEDTGVTYPSVADVEGGLKVPLRITGLPTTLFVDEGQVVASDRGAYSSYADLTSAVSRHLGVGS
jgi:cytochrome c biogenesis protein CcmG, thiol:disulfide interchange protein DsbE